MKEGIKQAVILAGGRGTRLRPFTFNLPKAMLPVRGKAVILHQMEALEKVDVEEVIIVAGEHSKELESFLSLNKKKFKIIYQPSPMGSAHALKFAIPFCVGDFVVMAGDYVFPVSHLRELVKKQKSGGVFATVSLKSLPWEKLKESSSSLSTASTSSLQNLSILL